MNLQRLLKSRISLALFAGLLYLTWKLLDQYFGLDESISGLGMEAIGVGNGGLALALAPAVVLAHFLASPPPWLNERIPSKR